MSTFWAGFCYDAMSKVYSLKIIQQIPVSVGEAWDFFSRPGNLKEITPPGFGFDILSEHPNDRMYPGQLIEYKVSPLLGIPLYWMTEITHVSDKEYFIDEQRFGPYRFWHHQHHFAELEGGVQMTDMVHYQLPFWLLGDMVHMLLVRKRLKEIFAYRFAAAEKRFGKWNNRG